MNEEYLVSLMKSQFKLLFTEEIKPLFDDLKQDVAILKQDVAMLKNEVVIIKKDIVSLKGEVAQIKDYINKDANAIENEIGPIIKNHYRETRKSNVHFMKYPLKKIHDCDGRYITDLDYAVIAYNEDEDFYQLIIIEAKHHINYDKINRKIEQIFYIQRWLQNIKNDYVHSDCHAQFYKDIDILERKKIFLKKFNEQILFYIGGPSYQQECVQYIQKIYNGKINKLIIPQNTHTPNMSIDEIKKTLEYLHNNIGIIIPLGDRYRVEDSSTLEKTIGGAVKTYKMKIMPNYINHVYT
jgi:hypothetical protein